MPPGVITLRKPGSGGVVGDRYLADLAPTEAAVLQDGIMPGGTIVQRGCWSLTGTPNPLGSTGKLAGVMAIEWEPLDPISLVGSDTLGRMGSVDNIMTNAVQGTANVTYLPRAFVNGEVIFCPQDGQSPMVRWTGLNFAPAAPTGATTVTLTAGSTVMVGAGTNFLTAAVANSYLSTALVPGRPFAVANVDSNTVLSMTTPSPVSGAGLSWGSAQSGYLGLGTTVTEAGTTSVAGTALTGKGTSWNTGLNAVKAGDLWAQRVAGGQYTNITLVNSPTSITLSSAPGAFTDVNYRIIRPAVAKDACIHQGRLFWTGVLWQPNRYYYSPVGFDIGRSYNERENFTTNFVEAYPADFRDVPAPNAQGRIEALLSAGEPGPLLILRNDGAWGQFGDASDPDIRQLAAGAGCISLRSACSGYGVLAWCGHDGIYLYHGGQIEDITDGKRGRYWRFLMANRTSAAIITAAIESSGHLVVSYNDGAASEVWPYDLRARAWLGNFTNMTARYISSYRPAPVSDGDPPQLPETYWIPESGIGGTSGRQPATMSACFRDEGLSAANANAGTLLVQTGPTLVGPPGDLARVTDMKVTYECYHPTQTATLTVSTSLNGSNFGDDVVLAPTTGGVPNTVRIRTTTDSTAAPAGKLGQAAGGFALKFTQSGLEPNILRIHQVELSVRKRRTRVA